VRVDDVDRGRRRLESRERHLQSAARHVVPHQPTRGQHDAGAVERRPLQDVLIVRAQARRDGHGDLAPVDKEPPAIGVGEAAVDEAAVARQLGRNARQTMPPEIAGRGADDAAELADAAGDEARIDQPADAHGGVDALLHEIDEAVGELQVDGDLRVAGEETGQRRRQVALAEQNGPADDELARRRGLEAGQGGLRLLDVAEDALAAGIVGVAALGQRQPPGGAVEQAGAELLLERGELPAHRGERRAERASGGRQAAGLHHAGERRHGREPIHRRSLSHILQ